MASALIKPVSAGRLARLEVFADIPAAAGQGHAVLFCPLFHQLVMAELIASAILKRSKAANSALVLDPFFRCH